MSYFHELVDIVNGSPPEDLDQAKAFLELYQSHTSSQLSSIFGVSSRTLRRWRSASEKLTGVKHNAVPEGQYVKGVSVLTDAGGNEVMRWTKTKEDVNREAEFLKSSVAGLFENIEYPTHLSAPKSCNSSLLSLYPIADWHLGVLACGEDIDTQTKLLINFMQYMIDRQPDSEEAVLCIMGDFLHWDSLTPKTPRSGHILQGTGTFRDIVKACFNAIRHIIKLLSEKHLRVRVEWVPGNHDEASSVIIREALMALYAEHDRVTISDPDIKFHAYKFGDVGLFMAHGDDVRVNDLPEIFTAYYPEIYGATKYRYGHYGHYHHSKVTEGRLMTLEQHNTLSPKSKHDKDKGYYSLRRQSVITYHKKYGEVDRSTACHEMLV